MTLSREFLHERDQRIYNLRATGMSPQAISKQFGITAQTVNAAISRRLSAINKQNDLTFVQVMLLELDRLDKLQTAQWPYTQPRRVKLDDGSEITVDPDPKAVDIVLRIMQMRTKLLGMDVQRIDVTHAPQEITHTLVGHEDASSQTNVEDESRKMLELGMQAGIFEEDVVKALLADRDAIDEAEVIDVESSEADNETDHVVEEEAEETDED